MDTDSRGRDLFIVDNSVSGWTGLRYLEEWAKIASAFDVATGFFEIGALLALDGKWQDLDRIRVLMGAEISARTRRILVDGVRRHAAEKLDRSIEADKQDNPFLKGVPAILDALRERRIECRIYDKGKFHAKAFITHARIEVVGSQALVGSSNFTKPGLTENIELNVQVQSAREVAQLQDWFEAHWSEAREVTDEMIEVVERHTRLYSPFDVYAKALQEFFRGHELTATEWDENSSKMFPRLDRYQQEAYWALMKIARKHGGAFLCDGVGLGKTFVGLMLIERLVLHEGKRVVLFAPKATREGVWEPHLREWLPHIGGGQDFSNLAVFSHTDLNRKGDFPERFRRVAELADLVVIDEAHHFRNPGTRGGGDREPSRYYRLYDILDNAVRPKTLFMLTATPINNRLSDFRHLIELFTRRDQSWFARTLGVNNLSAHVNRMENVLRQRLGDVTEHAVEAQEILSTDALFRELVVQRSRAYARESQIQQTGNAAVFPERKAPQVAAYSIRKTYGRLLELFEKAFTRDNPLFTLPMYYPLHWYKGSDQEMDLFEENRQKQVVGLIRTNFLKRFESSVTAFEVSCDRLLRKLLAFVEVHSESDGEKRRLDRWKRQNADILNYAAQRQFELWGDDDDESEDDDIVSAEMLEDVVKLDREDYEVEEMISETFLDLDQLARFLDEARKFESKHDDKLQKLTRLLQSRDLKGQKVLIFTEFADTARYLMRQLDDAGIEGVAQVDSASKTNRADVIQRFSPYYNGCSSATLAVQGGKEIQVLISTDVLSEGLNLQDASYVINYDIHWNPVRLMQRIGRVDRRMNPEVEEHLVADHPRFKNSRGKVGFWNFLPPEELNAILTLYTRVTQKTLLISRTLGIEGRKLLTPEDDFDALREFNHAYEGARSAVEDMNLEYQALIREDPGLESRRNRLPGATFSGKAPSDGGLRGVFFCYALPGFDKRTGEFTEETGLTRWYFHDLYRDAILEESGDIIASIRSKPDTPRRCTADEKTLIEIRSRVESTSRTPISSVSMRRLARRRRSSAGWSCLMPTDHRTALAAIRRFDQLIAFLRDEMDWPIASGDFEDLTFDYTPEELGIKVQHAAKIQEIKRLRPLAPKQPWGVFFVKFEPKRLPVVALRSILGRVVLKKRASVNDAEQPTWAMEDLLFISNYGEGEARQISFAHFAAPAGGNRLPTLKVLGWDDRATLLHLDHVARELTQRLAWPDDEDDADAWREQWRTAFTLMHRETINTSQALSVHLAGLARSIRERIHFVLEIESDNGRITALMKAFRIALIHDLDEDGFADMAAQTIAYGLLSARIADRERATVPDFTGQMKTNPLLRDLMATFLHLSHGDHGTRIDFDELGVADVVELLDRANMEAVVRDFGDRNPREDPVIHFYESFLTEYDKRKRFKRGVFYTPRPVVSYIIRSVDALLCEDFGLADGLADTSTWAEMAERVEGLIIPEGVSPEQDFVQILHPASGTGTFLVEVIELIYKRCQEKWQSQGHDKGRIEALWNEYVPRHLLPRLHGYELQMAPYTIAHLKISLKLYETGYRFGVDERARVYLTNALEPAQDFSDLLDFAVPAIAHEAQAVNEVKAGQRFTVILGNPPYSGHSANKGKWLRGLLHGCAGDRSVESYFDVDGNRLKERNPKWLNDDYTKFIRLAHWQIEQTGQGIVGFVTNHSYLDNPTFRGMRESLSVTFPRIFLLDLHGNTKKRERTPDGGKDENVFDIQQGVAIGLFARSANEVATVNHADLWGGREHSKFVCLLNDHVLSTPWQTLSPQSPLHLFVPRSDKFQDEYDSGWRLDHVFPVHQVGMTTARDRVVIDFEAIPILERARRFRDSKEADVHLCAELGIPMKKGWNISKARELLQREDDLEDLIKPVLRRPFDARLILYHDSLVWRTMKKLMGHMLAGKNIGIITTRQCKDNWSAMVSNMIITHKALDAYDINSLFPLYIYPLDLATKTSSQRTPNLDSQFTQTFKAAIGLDLITDGVGNLTGTFGPEDIFHYIYTVCYSPEYRRRYADFLKSEFPRIPLPGNRALFAELVPVGARLVKLHLMEAEIGSAVARVSFPVSGTNQVDKVSYTAGDGRSGRVWINRDQYFDGVAPDDFTFTIGGYRPAENWLKERQGRVLSQDDVLYYQRVITALAETRSRMTEIDDVISRHGGWPDAFQPRKTETSRARIIPFRPRKIEPELSNRFVTCVPLIPLQVAAGGFGDPQHLEDGDFYEWVAVEPRHRLRKGMFVAQVVGKSMEPLIPEGSWCLFQSPVEGTRQGKTVLVQLRDALDPETGHRYTVKRYTSEKIQADDAWRHTCITLNPVNPDFDPIVLTSDDEGDVKVVAELVEVLEGTHD